MSLKKKISALILTATVGVSGLIGYNAMNPSKPNYTDDSKTNVNRQMEHILNISKEPHTIFNSDKEAQDEVRNYLISELNELGVKTKTYKYDNVHLKNHEAYGENATDKVDLENIYGELKGKSDSYILLCTHYDSAGAKEGRYSQKEIAERTGWTNDTAFYNAFKKRYLQSPAKYKSENFVSDIISDTIDCSLLELSEIPIIFFIYQGSYADCLSGCFEEKSWELLYDYAQSNNLLPEKEEYWGICYDDRDITVDEKCCFYAGLTVRHMPNLKVDNEIKAMLLPKAEYAVYVHKGIYDKLDSFYNAILQQIPEGYYLGESLILERYLNSVADTSEEDLLTEVLLPVVKAKSNLL